MTVSNIIQTIIWVTVAGILLYAAFFIPAAAPPQHAVQNVSLGSILDYEVKEVCLNGVVYYRRANSLTPKWLPLKSQPEVCTEDLATRKE